MSALERVKAVLAQLPEADLKELHSFLSDLVEMPAALPKRAMEAQTVASVRETPDGDAERARTVTYRRETVRCGKKACRKCPHGPYLYKYWREGGRLKKKYVGKAAIEGEGKATPPRATQDASTK